MSIQTICVGVLGKENSMRKTIALILSTSAYGSGQHQYAKIIAECIYKNSSGRYNVLAFCRNRFWTQWCMERHIKYYKYSWNNTSIADVKLNEELKAYIKYYHQFITPIGSIIRKNKVSLIVDTCHGDFIPDYGCKIMYPVHDLMHIYEKCFPEVKSDYQYRELLHKHVTQIASVVLVDSELGKKQLYESYKEHISKRLRIEVLPFTVPEHIQYCEEEYIKAPSKYIFYPATFWNHKNHIGLLKAIILLKERIPDIKVIFVGQESNSTGNVKAFITENHLEKIVTIYGHVSDGQITYLYKHATAMIMPSFFGPTNIPPLEAMALGCPVAVSNNYAMGEQVGDAGLLFSPYSPEEIAQCIFRLWTDESLRQRLIENGHKQINKWTKKDFENRLMDIVYTELGSVVKE